VAAVEAPIEIGNARRMPFAIFRDGQPISFDVSGAHMQGETLCLNLDITKKTDVVITWKDA
jgi:hypothetical protein